MSLCASLNKQTKKAYILGFATPEKFELIEEQLFS